jgi:hypothetical protein
MGFYTKKLKLLMDSNGAEPAWRNINIIALEPLFNLCHVMIKAEMRV